MENIFEGAKFRDMFLTRDGRIAVYQKYENGWYHLFTKNIEILVCPDGCVHSFVDSISNDDIVSRYQELIDEEKKVIIDNACKWLQKNICYFEASKEDKKNLNILIDILQASN